MELYDRVYVNDQRSRHHRRYGEVVGYAECGCVQVLLFSDPPDEPRWFRDYQLALAPADGSVYIP